MALTCPTGFDVVRLRTEVRSTYERVATQPGQIHPFHRGLHYAVNVLGYDRGQLEALPPEATASFAGVGNPHRIGPLPETPTVLDIGCGAGTDLLLAARRAGPGCRVIGVDMTPGMRALARKNAARLELSQRVDVRPGIAEDLPLGSESVDVVMTNGVLNLVTDKVRAFSEIGRVLRPGGVLHMADVLLDADLHERERMDPYLWADGIAGALPETELFTVLGALGFEDVEITARFDCFAGTPVAQVVSPRVGPHGANVYARRPA